MPTSMKLILHNYWRSSASYRVRIALGLKQLAYEYVSVHLVQDGGQQHASAYQQLNPMAQVPTLEVLEDGGARHVLTQSLPIIEFLDERVASPSLLIPTEAYARARVRAFAEIINAGIQPLQNLAVTMRIKAMGGDDKAWIIHFMQRGLAALEQAVATPTPTAIVGEQRFCFGTAPTMADCCLVPQLYAARRFGVDLAPYPTLVAIETSCAQLAAFADAAPDRQPDAVAAV